MAATFIVVCTASGIKLHAYPTRELAEYNVRALNGRPRPRSKKPPRYAVIEARG